MKNLGISFALSFIVSILFFCILDFVMGMETHAAYGVAGLPLVASAHLYELLERVDGRKEVAEFRSNDKQVSEIHTFDSYTIHWFVLVLYGVLIMTATLEFNGGIVGFLAGTGAAISGTTDMLDKAPIVPLVLQLPINLVGVYLLARWVGSRSSNHGILVITAVIVLSVIIVRFLDYSIMRSSVYKLAFGSRNVYHVLGISLGGVIMYMAPGLIGYWRGCGMRLMKYLRYLLSILPQDTRDVIVTLAYEEAQKIGSRRAAA